MVEHYLVLEHNRVGKDNLVLIQYLVVHLVLIQYLFLIYFQVLQFQVLIYNLVQGVHRG